MPQRGLPCAVVSDTTLIMANHLTLSRWLEREAITRAEFARRCEYDPSNLTKLLRGTVRPSLDVAARIERLTEGAVPATGWAA
jgi:transcriptional regulator with XRE-family HTH domain